MVGHVNCPILLETLFVPDTKALQVKAIKGHFRKSGLVAELPPLWCWKPSRVAERMLPATRVFSYSGIIAPISNIPLSFLTSIKVTESPADTPSIVLKLGASVRSIVMAGQPISGIGS